MEIFVLSSKSSKLLLFWEKTKENSVVSIDIKIVYEWTTLPTQSTFFLFFFNKIKWVGIRLMYVCVYIMWIEKHATGWYSKQESLWQHGHRHTSWFMFSCIKQSTHIIKKKAENLLFKRHIRIYCRTQSESQCGSFTLRSMVSCLYCFVGYFVLVVVFFRSFANSSRWAHIHKKKHPEPESKSYFFFIFAAKIADIFIPYSTIRSIFVVVVVAV